MVVRQLQHESCDSLYDSLMTAYLDVEQPRRLLLEVCEDCRQSLGTEFRIRADRGKLPDCLQEVCVSVGRICFGK